MRLVLTALITTLWVCSTSFGQSYDTSQIPDSLKENAHAVLRYDLNTFKLNNIGNGTFYNKYAITILNSSGKRWADVYGHYDKLEIINQLNAKLYDSRGNLIRKIKKSDIKDFSSYDGFSLYSDNRTKYIDLSYNQYPYTIEVEIEKTYDGLFFLPSWRPIPGENIAVEHSEYIVDVPIEYEVRYDLHLVEEPTVSENEFRKTYSWKAENKKAVEYEKLSHQSILPRVSLAPSAFEIEGFSGDLNSWQSFGDWINSISAGRDDLTPAHLEEIKQLVGQETDKRKIVQIVYEYLQSNTRYVSIQLGLGGWQPFHASTVAEKGYGDCKALTFYTKSILEKFGVTARYTLVNAGKNAKTIDPEFPSQQFNHVFLCVPFENDTIWLECTSQTNPFGYLGKFTSDRDVLVIDENGGSIVRTPKYKVDQNVLLTNITIDIDEHGNASGKIISKFNGLTYDYISRFPALDEKEKRDYINYWYDLSGMKVLDYQYKESKSELPSFTLSTQIAVDHLASITGKRFFLVPNLVNPINTIPDQNMNRKTDFRIRYGRTEIDSISFNIPENIRVEHLPKPKKITSEFGSYESYIQVEQGLIKYFRKFIINDGVFDKSKYPEYVKFYQNCARADKKKVVFVKST